MAFVWHTPPSWLSKPSRDPLDVADWKKKKKSNESFQDANRYSYLKQENRCHMSKFTSAVQVYPEKAGKYWQLREQINIQYSLCF